MIKFFLSFFSLRILQKTHPFPFGPFKIFVMYFTSQGAHNLSMTVIHLNDFPRNLSTVYVQDPVGTIRGADDIRRASGIEIQNIVHGLVEGLMGMAENHDIWLLVLEHLFDILKDLWRRSVAVAQPHLQAAHLKYIPLGKDLAQLQAIHVPEDGAYGLNFSENLQVVHRAEITGVDDQVHFLEVIQQLFGDGVGMGIGNDAYFHRTMYGLSKRVSRVFNSCSFHIQKRSCRAFSRVFSSRSCSDMIK